MLVKGEAVFSNGGKDEERGWSLRRNRRLPLYLVLHPTIELSLSSSLEPFAWPITLEMSKRCPSPSLTGARPPSICSGPRPFQSPSQSCFSRSARRCPEPTWGVHRPLYGSKGAHDPFAISTASVRSAACDLQRCALGFHSSANRDRTARSRPPHVDVEAAREETQYVIDRPTKSGAVFLVDTAMGRENASLSDLRLQRDAVTISPSSRRGRTLDVCLSLLSLCSFPPRHVTRFGS